MFLGSIGKSATLFCMDYDKSHMTKKVSVISRLQMKLRKLLFNWLKEPSCNLVNILFGFFQ